MGESRRPKRENVYVVDVSQKNLRRSARSSTAAATRLLVAVVTCLYAADRLLKVIERFEITLNVNDREITIKHLLHKWVATA